LTLSGRFDKKSSKIMPLKEIEKLREKVEKDPNSKLFVPLAEEYRKEGMLDEAIQVLLTGIERQPGYMSARVSLGKIYLEKGMRDEARAEFENVIKSIPDNLYAHKKLAEIYRDSGEKELAVQSYRTILRLNSMDEDALASLQDIEAAGSSKEAPEENAGGEAPREENVLEGHIYESHSEESPSADSGFQDVDAGSPEPAHEELNAFKESLFGNGNAEGGVTEEAAAEEAPQGAEAEDSASSAWEDAAGELSVGTPVEDEAVEIEEIPQGDEEVVPEEISAGADIAAADVYVAETAGEGGEGAGGLYPVSIEDADRKVSEGDYGEAVRIYRKVLSENPDDRRAIQRLKELRGLLKMLGKDNEELIDRLNGFLEGIQKRHDEFLGRT